jgi:hypothetical protein
MKGFILMDNQTPIALPNINATFNQPNLLLTWNAVDGAIGYYVVVHLIPRYMQSPDELRELFDGIINNNQLLVKLTESGYINVCLTALGLTSIPQKSVRTDLLLIPD